MLTSRQLKRTIRTPDGHTLWTGALANGYPAGKHEGKTVYLKRLIWEETHGPIPEGFVVTSTCGERTCIEPGHLALSAPGRYPTVRNGLGRYAPAGDVPVLDVPVVSGADLPDLPGSEPSMGPEAGLPVEGESGSPSLS